MKLEAVEELLDERERRKSEIRYIVDFLNSPPEAYELSRVGIEIVTQAIEEMERRAGRSLSSLHDEPDFFDRLAKHIVQIDPSKLSRRSVGGEAQTPRTVKHQSHPPARGSYIVPSLLLIGLIAMVLSYCAGR